MQLPKPDSVGFETCPPGTHVAICYRFIDLGTQRYQHPGGPRDQHKVMLSWELPDALIQEGDHAGEPFTFHQQYTWSMHEKATLRKHLESWRGIPFREEDFGEDGCNIRDLLGKPCMLTLAPSSRSYKSQISLLSISRLVKGKRAPHTPQNPITYFSMEGPYIDLLTFDRLSDKLQATIRKSPEYDRLTRAVPIRIWARCIEPHAQTLYGGSPNLAQTTSLLTSSGRPLSLARQPERPAPPQKAF
ncbi:phage replication initiation protein, NGO0469 family [Henriciella sp.]|uniref:phage replication initiation protein, NGO0469 family n=1 Tax=Henriciella sp. TaxID=1968823 RepID=UPI002614F2FB|nr:hypothetical protein [Henriciella sp.]